MNLDRGPRVPADPRLSVVVMSVDCDPNALLAVQSIPGGFEKILVNTGQGSFRGAVGLDDVILVEDDRKALPGRTRNLGIAQASAPIIAFLAADCVMPAAAYDRRMVAHRDGYDLVSSTLRPYGDSLASWASYLYLHKSRMPEFQKPGSSLFGVSYRRDVFDRLGLFREDMRIAEDTEFNARCTGLRSLLARDVVTYHRYPETLREACRDVARRAVIEMRSRQRSGLRQARGEALKSLKLSLGIMLSPKAPMRARMAAFLVPVLGMAAMMAALIARNA
ncbi:glycosyltransferase family 2 protein [Paracoccus sp. (in: a-proteobacteria)]|uniref:glycosyltransferase n=1 Tax=Paracoccus sp. TaxID=267 RepID=UPI0026DEB345|nr:hypothetical protein [Paracoccus sp. (in: a-proteobacteria)]MDO5648379.1 hypothetical protein [Paracoccus sp. (in: a-proteobacteria)]